MYSYSYSWYFVFQDDSERAQQAFEIVNRSWKTLENEETRKKCLDIYQEAKERTDHMVCE
jgi:DnaJ homolog subfamily C member 8